MYKAYKVYGTNYTVLIAVGTSLTVDLQTYVLYLIYPEPCVIYDSHFSRAGSQNHVSIMVTQCMTKVIFLQPLQCLLIGLKNKVVVVALMEVLHQLNDMNFLPLYLRCN